jgi:PTH1 family peptidyl-tRNA hydrolase
VGLRSAFRAGSAGAPVDWLIIGLGNPGPRHTNTPHNVGFEVANLLIERWQLGAPRPRFNAVVAQGRAGAGGPPVAVMMPQTYMNESGSSAGPARGMLKVELDRVIAVHDEIDLPFGDIRARIGGGLAGHNGLKSLKAGFGSAEFQRVRVGVGRPDTTDPEIVSAYVLGRWTQSREEVAELVARAADAVVAVIEAGAVADVPLP